MPPHTRHLRLVPPAPAAPSRARQMTKLSIEIGRQLFPETDHRRPQTRAEMARHVRHVRRKGVPAMRLPDGVREVVVSPEPPEAEGEEVAA